MPSQGASGLGHVDLDLLRCFVAIAEAGGFTRASARLLRTQSTISLQLKRLEERLDRRLFDRSPRLLRLTPEGEALLPDARALLALHDAMLARMAGPLVEGVVRLGTPEDFATAHLPTVLARFASAHPGVALEVTCDLTMNLVKRFRAGEFDLVLLKRELRAGTDGVRVWREPLVWVASGEAAVTRVASRTEPLPLAVSPAPCVYRKRATGALEKIGMRWRIAYTCGSLAGTLAAVKAGLGVAVLPKEMVPPGFTIIDGGLLPELPDTEIALLSAQTSAEPVRRLASHITRSLERGVT